MRLRYLLPLCNLVIDAALLMAAIHVVDVERRTFRQPHPLWSQYYKPVDPIFLRNADFYPPPAPVPAIISGTLPATLARIFHRLTVQKPPSLA